MSPTAPAPAAATAATHASPPIFGRAALAILGSMLLLIAALTVVLVQTTWAAADAGIEAPASADHPDFTGLAHR